MSSSRSSGSSRFPSSSSSHSHSNSKSPLTKSNKSHGSRSHSPTTTTNTGPRWLNQLTSFLISPLTARTRDRDRHAVSSSDEDGGDGELEEETKTNPHMDNDQMEDSDDEDEHTRNNHKSRYESKQPSKSSSSKLNAKSSSHKTLRASNSTTATSFAFPSSGSSNSTSSKPSSRLTSPALKPTTLDVSDPLQLSKKSTTPIAMGFNGNQWIDRFGNPRKSADGTPIMKPTKKGKKGKRSAPKAPRPATSPQLTSSAAATASSVSVAAGAPTTSASSRRIVAPIPLSVRAAQPSPPSGRMSSQGFRAGSNPTTPVVTPVTTNLAALTFSTPFFRHANTPANIEGLTIGAGAMGGSSPTFSPMSTSSNSASLFAAASGASSSSGHGGNPFFSSLNVPTVPSKCHLAPHPAHSYQINSAFLGRAGASSSSANHTPRKRNAAMRSEESTPVLHSVVNGVSLPYTYANSQVAAPSYIHFRSRFKNRASVNAASKARAKNSLQAQLAASATSSVHGGKNAIDPMNRRKIPDNLSSAATGASSTTTAKGKKNASSSSTTPAVTPYTELLQEMLTSHTVEQPSDADPLWHSLQHRGLFSSVETIQPLLEDSSSSSSSSSSSNALIAPFNYPLPIHQSSIKPYYRFEDCDDETLRLFTGLKSFVRYHRIRGLVASSGTSKKSKGARGTVADLDSLDPILNALNEISKLPPPTSSDSSDDSSESGSGSESGSESGEEDEEDEDDDDDDMDTSDGAASRRHLRARASPAPSASTAALFGRNEPSTLFSQLLQDTNIIPTSLNAPCSVLNDALPSFFVVPLSTQLLLARYQSAFPSVFNSKISHVKPKQLCVVAAASSLKVISSPNGEFTPAEDAFMNKNAALLPASHQRFVRLFFSHVKLFSKDPTTSTSSSSVSPLLDHLYHFNLISFSSALLYHLYQNTMCHKFILSVDPLIDRLPSYYRDQVKNPMSMYDLDMRLVCGYYDSLLEFLNDLWRCFENTLLFHSKPFHRHVNENKSQAEERKEKEGGTLSRDMVDQVRHIWKEVRSFIDEHYQTFMTHHPAGVSSNSPRTTTAYTQMCLSQVRQWMDEVRSREVQTLKLLWIAHRELEFPDAAIPMQPLAQWREFNADQAENGLDEEGGGSDDNTERGSNEDDDEVEQPRKKLKTGYSSSTSSKKAIRSTSPVRLTRQHIQMDPLLNVNNPYPPLAYSRSQAGRHARNLPGALVRKLGRRGGKPSYNWDSRWFYFAKKE